MRIASDRQNGTPPWRLVSRHCRYPWPWSRPQYICVFEDGLGEHSRLELEVPKDVWHAFDGITFPVLYGPAGVNLGPGDVLKSKLEFHDGP